MRYFLEKNAKLIGAVAGIVAVLSASTALTLYIINFFENRSERAFISQLNQEAMSLMQEMVREKGGVKEFLTMKPKGKVDVDHKWKYLEELDVMSNKMISKAEMVSLNQVDFGAIAQGTQYGTLTIVSHPRYGNQITLSVNDGLFFAPPRQGRIIAKFDSGQGRAIPASWPSAMAPRTISISNYDWFIENLKTATNLSIEARGFQDVILTFSFNVKGFDQNKYSGGKI
ncbi:MAG: hypothetical protein HY910_00450 [Desulfarculus sp.]|nr:hypothetical protein [Desulfarculus sp.]